MNRCILIFPKFDNIDVIQKIRKKYDKVYSCVPPHITLVFPFESDIKKEVIDEHIKNALKNIKPFELELNEVATGDSFEGNIFLEVSKGVKELTKMHKALYTGVLKEYKKELNYTNKFIPHLTVGQLETKEAAEKAVEELKDINETFSTVVTEVTVEIIGENNACIIENIIELKN